MLLCINSKRTHTNVWMKERMNEWNAFITFASQPKFSILKQPKNRLLRTLQASDLLHHFAQNSLIRFQFFDYIGLNIQLELVNFSDDLVRMKRIQFHFVIFWQSAIFLCVFVWWEYFFLGYSKHCATWISFVVHEISLFTESLMRTMRFVAKRAFQIIQNQFKQLKKFNLAENKWIWDLRHDERLHVYKKVACVNMLMVMLTVWQCLVFFVDFFFAVPSYIRSNTYTHMHACFVCAYLCLFGWLSKSCSFFLHYSEKICIFVSLRS